MPDPKYPPRARRVIRRTTEEVFYVPTSTADDLEDQLDGLGGGPLDDEDVGDDIDVEEP